MYNSFIHKKLNSLLLSSGLDISGADNAFYTRFIANATAIDALYHEIYGHHPKATPGYESLVNLVVDTYKNRSKELRSNDSAKELKEHWFLDNKLAPISLSGVLLSAFTAVSFKITDEESSLLALSKSRPATNSSW